MTYQVQVIAAVADCIREVGAVPSGHLYAILMAKMDLDTYQAIIRTLVRAGLVEDRAFG